jgi:hypothetical protein
MVISGTVIEVINATDSITNVVVKVKHNDFYFPICFTAFGEIKALICQLRIEKKDIVKITYYVKSKKHEERYFTSAIIEKISVAEKWNRQISIGMTDEEMRNLEV